MKKYIFPISVLALLLLALALSVWALTVAYRTPSLPTPPSTEEESGEEEKTENGETEDERKELLALIAQWEELLAKGEQADASLLARFESLLSSMDAATESNNAKQVYKKAKACSVSLLTFYPGDGEMDYSGSGFFLNENGLVATAYHVIAGAERIEVKMSSGKRGTVTKIVGYDVALDVAILETDLESTTPAVISKDALSCGDVIYALGRHSGADFTFSSSLLASTNDVMKNYPERRLIRFCNLIQNGSSGGAVFNEKGEVIGMVQLRDTSYGALQWAIQIAQVTGVSRELSLTPAALSESLAFDLSPNLSYTVKNGEAYITGLSASVPAKTHTVRIPCTLGGYPVVSLSLAEGVPLGSSVCRILLPEGLRILDRAALSLSSSIEELRLPSTVTEVKADALLGATSLCSAVAPNGILVQKNGALYSADGKTLYKLLSAPKDGVLSLTGVRVVGAHAAYGQAVTALHGGEDLLSIGEEAFFGTRLSQLSGLSSLQAIGRGAFASCTYLTEVSLPDGIAVLSEEAFYGCTRLTLLRLPETLTRIDARALAECTALKTLVFPNALSVIASEAFKNTAISSLSLPVSLVAVGANAFEGTPLRTLTLASLPYLQDAFVFGDAAALCEATVSLPSEKKDEALKDTAFRLLLSLAKDVVYQS